MDAKSYSQLWLEQFAEELGFSVETVMAHAKEWLNSGGGEDWKLGADPEYWCEGGTFEGQNVPEEFWQHYKEVTGEEGSGSFFTCSC